MKVPFQREKAELLRFVAALTVIARAAMSIYIYTIMYIWSLP